MKAFTPQQVVVKFQQLRSSRSNFEDLWQNISDYVQPTKNDVQYSRVAGERKFVNLLDTTAQTSGELLAGALHGMLTNPAGYFFGLSTGDTGLDNNDNVRLWTQDVVRRMHTVLNQSNFQTEVHELYLDLSSFGFSPMSMEEDPDTVVNFSTRPIREVYVEENSKGRIDTIYRCIQWTAKDMCDEFGYENLPEKIQKAYDAGKTEKFEVIHAVYPSKRVKGVPRGTKKSFPIVSQYVLASEKVELNVEGFYELPYLTPRWSKLAGEAYGRGPGEKALGPARTVNKMRETTLRGAQKVVDPPLQAPDDGFVLPLDTRPAGLNYYRAGSQDRIEAIFNDSRIDFGFQAIDQERAQIREAFYTDQLKLREGPQMTATEVAERVEQALRFLGPMLGRMQAEFLQPLIERLYKIMDRLGMIPEVPAELTDIELKVQYTSVMAMSQRLSEVQSIRRTMQEIAPFMSMNPNIADNFDGDAAVRYISKLTQFPQEILLNADSVKQIRDQRAKAQQEAMQAAQQGEQVDQASKLTTAAAKFAPAGAA
jgi:hypothetical protein